MAYVSKMVADGLRFSEMFKILLFQVNKLHGIRRIFCALGTENGLKRLVTLFEE